MRHLTRYGNRLYTYELAFVLPILANYCSNYRPHFSQRRPVTSAMTWLLIIYILPLVGIIAYIAFGELHLGKRRVDKARDMWPSVATWLENLRNSKHIFATDNSPVAEPLFQLIEKRQGIAGVKGNRIQLLTTCEDSLKAIVNDINNAQHSIEMVFYIWQPGGLVDGVTEALPTPLNGG